MPTYGPMKIYPLLLIVAPTYHADAFQINRCNNADVNVVGQSRCYNICVPRDDATYVSSASSSLYATTTDVSLSQSIGNGSLKAVETLAGAVTRVGNQQKADAAEENDREADQLQLKDVDDLTSRPGVFKALLEETAMSASNSDKEKNTSVVLKALASLERDMAMLDNVTGQRSQLSVLEISLLAGSVVAAATSPILGNIGHVLAPASAAFCAAIGIGAEYTGKVAVSDGKEIAAATIVCAAEAEGLLAQAERVKAVLPLCVGVGATCASFSLLLPAVLNIADNGPMSMNTALFLISPVISVVAAAISSLTLQETRSFCYRAISTGNRRFARSGSVGRTWLSQTEQIERNSQRTRLRWNNFAAAVIPAPLIGALLPVSSLGGKAIIVTALAAMESAFFLAQAEYTLSRATDAVALKARSASVADTYANQGARSGAILPFTSALSALCAAATAAIVEFPLPGHNLVLQGGVYSIFPAFAAMFSAAASVSKARCEVDAEAATQAASTLALEYDVGTSKAAGERSEFDAFNNDDLILRPFQGVIELIRLTAVNTWKTVKLRNQYPAFVKLVYWVRKRWRRYRKSDSQNESVHSEDDDASVGPASPAMAS
mmetsp:Transcript_25279/g.39153  ORF Transcript_25279/g.39153 Transcript_25279/m.39153 type:complete len:606 (+) Transcript_25279:140-1957(+)